MKKSILIALGLLSIAALPLSGCLNNDSPASIAYGIEQKARRAISAVNAMEKIDTRDIIAKEFQPIANMSVSASGKAMNTPIKKQEATHFNNETVNGVYYYNGSQPAYNAIYGVDSLGRFVTTQNNMPQQKPSYQSFGSTYQMRFGSREDYSRNALATHIGRLESIYDISCDLVAATQNFGSLKNEVIHKSENLKETASQIRAKRLQLNKDQKTSINEAAKLLDENTNMLKQNKKEAEKHISDLKMSTVGFNANLDQLSIKSLRMLNTFENRMSDLKNTAKSIDQLSSIIKVAETESNFAYDAKKINDMVIENAKAQKEKLQSNRGYIDNNNINDLSKKSVNYHNVASIVPTTNANDEAMHSNPNIQQPEQVAEKSIRKTNPTNRIPNQNYTQQRVKPSVTERTLPQRTTTNRLQSPNNNAVTTTRKTQPYNNDVTANNNPTQNQIAPAKALSSLPTNAEMPSNTNALPNNNATNPTFDDLKNNLFPSNSSNNGDNTLQNLLTTKLSEQLLSQIFNQCKAVNPSCSDNQINQIINQCYTENPTASPNDISNMAVNRCSQISDPRYTSQGQGINNMPSMQTSITENPETPSVLSANSLANNATKSDSVAPIDQITKPIERASQSIEDSLKPFFPKVENQAKSNKETEAQPMTETDKNDANQKSKTENSKNENYSPIIRDITRNNTAKSPMYHRNATTQQDTNNTNKANQTNVARNHSDLASREGTNQSNLTKKSDLTNHEDSKFSNQSARYQDMTNKTDKSTLNQDLAKRTEQSTLISQKEVQQNHVTKPNQTLAPNATKTTKKENTTSKNTSDLQQNTTQNDSKNQPSMTNNNSKTSLVKNQENRTSNQTRLSPNRAVSPAINDQHQNNDTKKDYDTLTNQTTKTAPKSNMTTMQDTNNQNKATPDIQNNTTSVKRENSHQDSGMQNNASRLDNQQNKATRLENAAQNNRLDNVKNLDKANQTNHLDKTTKNQTNRFDNTTKTIENTKQTNRVENPTQNPTNRSNQTNNTRLGNTAQNKATTNQTNLSDKYEQKLDKNGKPTIRREIPKPNTLTSSRLPAKKVMPVQENTNAFETNKNITASDVASKQNLETNQTSNDAMQNKNANQTLQNNFAEQTKPKTDSLLQNNEKTGNDLETNKPSDHQNLTKIENANQKENTSVSDAMPNNNLPDKGEKRIPPKTILTDNDRDLRQDNQPSTERNVTQKHEIQKQDDHAFRFNDTAKSNYESNATNKENNNGFHYQPQTKNA